MANIKVPERYSHDTLRDRLQHLESVSLMIGETIHGLTCGNVSGECCGSSKDGCCGKGFSRGCDDGTNRAKLERLWSHHQNTMNEFRHAFEEHDIEMQFVDELVEDKKQKDRIIQEMRAKDEMSKRNTDKVNRVRIWVTTIIALLTLLGILGMNLFRYN